MSAPEAITALFHARSVLGGVRMGLEQLEQPALRLSAQLAEAQVTIGEVLEKIERAAKEAA